MPDNQSQEWEMDGKELQIVGDQTGALSFSSGVHSLPDTGGIQRLSHGDNTLIDDAQWKAFHDAREIESVMEGGQPIRIDQTKIDARIKTLVNTHLQKNSSNGGPPSKSEYQRLIGICGKAYMGTLKRGD